MNLTYQILAAVVLDLLVGDPRWLPHPVRCIGWLAQWLERPMRRLIRGEKAAGIVTVLLVILTAGVSAWGVIRIAGICHPLAADIVAIILIYTTIAAHDLKRHNCAVFRALAAGDLEQARRRVAEIVGRDTAHLDEAGVARAAVECVAESTVDGVTAPLFFAILGRRPMQSWRILRRDGRKHASPNAGLPEAAMAGALGIQLGGLNYYDGEPLAKPAIGEPVAPLAAEHILAANAVMFVTLALFLAFGLAVRIGVIHLWHVWRINA